MRKRSASESGQLPLNTTNVKQRKIHHSTIRAETSKKKGSSVSEGTNALKRARTEKHSSEKSPSNLTSNASEKGGSTRRSTNVLGSSEVSSKTQNGSPEIKTNACEKVKGLPDIMHDWEIIVNSLKVPILEEENLTGFATPVKKMIKSPSIGKIKSGIKTPKQEYTDSDKENGTSRKRSTYPDTQDNSEHISQSISPLDSRNKISLYENSSLDRTAENSGLAEGSILWRRPTRSTYRAFEIFDEVANDEANGDLNREVKKLLDSLTPKRPDSSDKEGKLNMNESLHSPISSDERRKMDVKLESKNIGKRRITRRMEKEGICLVSDESSDESDRDSELKFDVPKKENSLLFDSNDEELDFLGFGTPPSVAKLASPRSKLDSKVGIKITPHKLPKRSPVKPKSSITRELSFQEDKLLVNPTVRLVDLSPKSKYTKTDSSNYQVIEEFSIESDVYEKASKLDLKSDKDEFDLYFGMDNDSVNDFEGFPSANIEKHQEMCKECEIVFMSRVALKQHRKIGHRRVYVCPFDLGQCGQFQGAVNLHIHLASAHSFLFSFLQANICADIQSGKVAQWTSGEEGCGICLMSLDQPERCLHEMLIHGVWPPSLLSLAPLAIDQHMSLWWTTRTLAFACHLCHTLNSDQGPAQQKSTIPIVSCSPHSFPTLLCNHFRNIHKLNVPLIYGWWLLHRLLVSLPAIPRRTLSSIVSLGVVSKVFCPPCLMCSLPLRIYTNSGLNLRMPHGLCNRCEILCRNGTQCWFESCGKYVNSSSLANHILSGHKEKVKGGWCVVCGAWAPNILAHLSRCSVENKANACKFCSFIIGKSNVMKKVWHSLFHHTYPCPIPNCLMPLYTPSQIGSHRRLPTARTLLNHLLGQHLPEWSGLSLEQVSMHLFNSRSSQGFILTDFSSQPLQGVWCGLSGHRHLLAHGILLPINLIKVSIKCILCKHTREECLNLESENQISLCGECSLWLTQCGGGDPTPQCPVYTCLNNISSFSDLYQHLCEHHKLSSVIDIQNLNKTKCQYCSGQSLFSPLACITHYLVKHTIACLICPYSARTPAKIQSHRSEVHNIFNWPDCFDYLKSQYLKENKDEKPIPPSSGVMQVWGNETGTQAQWDPALDFSHLVIPNNDGDDGEHPRVINQSFEGTEVLQVEDGVGATGVDPWCSSICAVSMSPAKTIESLDKKAKSDYFTKTRCNDETIDQFEDSNEAGMEIQMSPSMIMPVVTVNDGSTSSDSDSEPALEIDSSAASPEHNACSRIQSENFSSPTYDNRFTVKIPVSVPLPQNKTSDGSPSNELTKNDLKTLEPCSTSSPAEIPTFGLVDTLNSVMAETLESMSKVFAQPLDPERKQSGLKTSLRKVESKGMGDNACIDEAKVAHNILKDLEDHFSSTCVGCGFAVSLPLLNDHIEQYHPGFIVQCQCDFSGSLDSFLVHSFHMGHKPCEARPIIISGKPGIEGRAMIVLEARPQLKMAIYPCYKCGKKLKQEKSRQLHYNLCKLEKKYSCEVCGEKFGVENHLNKHKEWKHNPQSCKYCGKDFNSSSSLKQHVLHIHKKMLNYKCDKCKDSFNTSKQLKVHLRVHSGYQPHLCSQCGKAFISKNLLSKHGDCNPESQNVESKDNCNSLPTREKRSKVKTFIPRKGLKSGDKFDTLAFTESDLETSSSDLELPSSEVSKKSKATHKQPNKVSNRSSPLHLKKDNHHVGSDRVLQDQNSSIQKGTDLKMAKAGIYQDKEPVILPVVRANILQKVESTIGRVCGPCSQEFESVAGKMLHMYLLHPGLVLSLGFHECCFCDHKFSSIEDVSDHHLDKHQRTPLKDGTFKCMCGLVFREVGAYYFHLYYAHKAQRALNVGGEIVCRLCDGHPKLNKVVDLVVHLSDRHTMFDHVRFNDSYMCNFCYKAFESWTVLSLHFFMVHKATKSQTLSYDCPYCQGASPWHSLEALQYHLDNVHRGKYTKVQTVPEHSRSIYNPAPIPSSPSKKDIPTKPILKKKILKKKSKMTRTISNNKDSDQEPLYCICQCPYDEVSNMIGCDNDDCKFQWFHFECVGIMSAPEGSWYCPECVGAGQLKQKEKRRQQHKQQLIQQDLYDYYNTYTNDEELVASTSSKVQSSVSLEQQKLQTFHSNLNASQSSSSDSSSSSSSSDSSNSSSSSSSSDSSSDSGTEDK